MTPRDLMLAADLMRGFHTGYASFKRWARERGVTPEDEALIRKIDIAAQGAKEWLRHKFIEGGQPFREK